MTLHRVLPTLLLLLASLPALSQAPKVEAPVPPLKIEDKGELQLAGDDFDYQPWSSDAAPGKVHIVQYFGGTRGDSKLFEPLTDRMHEIFTRDQYHVTTIINLDAALWGTTGMVVSEVKDSKREYPDSTMVLDEEGTGVEQWQLGESGAVLMIVDTSGIVRYLTREAMSDADVDRSVELVREQLEACLKSC